MQKLIRASICLLFFASLRTGVATAGTPYEDLSLTNGLVAYYPFNGNAHDASGNGHHAVVHGATYTNAGCSGGGYYFDGSGDYIDLGNATKQTGPFTVSIWFTYEVTENRNVSLYGGGGLDTHVDRNGIAISRNDVNDRLQFELYTTPARYAVVMEAGRTRHLVSV